MASTGMLRAAQQQQAIQRKQERDAFGKANSTQALAKSAVRLADVYRKRNNLCPLSQAVINQHQLNCQLKVTYRTDLATS